MTLPPTPAQRARDVAISTVDAHALPTWKFYARRAVATILESRIEFNADDVWALLEEWRVVAPHEPRALGAVLVRLRKEGIIEPTSTFVSSTRVVKHAGPTRVWRCTERRLF